MHHIVVTYLLSLLGCISTKKVDKACVMESIEGEGLELSDEWSGQFSPILPYTTYYILQNIIESILLGVNFYKYTKNLISER